LKPTRPAVAVARGASYLIVYNFASIVISIVAFAFIARLISQEEMGGLAVLMLITAGTQLLSSLGLGSTATKFVSSLEATSEYDKMRAAGYECIIINLATTSIIASSVYFSADALASSLLGSMSRAGLIRLLLPEICAVGIRNPLSNILYGLKKFREISITNVVAFALRQGLVVAFLGLGLGLSGIVIGWGIGDSFNSLVLGLYTRRFLGPPNLGFGFGKLLKFSAPLFLEDAASYAWTWFDRALLLPLVSLAQLGSYNVAVTAYGLLNSTPSVLSGTLFPYYSHFHPDGSQVSQAIDLGNAVRTASRYVSFLAIPLSVGLGVVSLPAVTLLAGSAYADAAYPLVILSFSLALSCYTYALSSIFVVLGKPVTSAGITIASVLIPIFIGILVIPYLGIPGASIARGLSLAISLIFSILVLRKFLKVRFDMQAYGHAWIASLIMAVAVLVAEELFYNKYLLPVYVAIGAVVFIAVLRLLHAVKPEDLELISDFLGPRMGVITRILQKILAVKAESSN
jgi:O-antigen/teichoic acid export membrane protein